MSEECRCIETEIFKIVGACPIHGAYETRWVEEVEGRTQMKRLTEAERLEAMATKCPGYGDEQCDSAVKYLQCLLNDPRCFCERHAQQADAFWGSQGWPSTSYLNLRDGTFGTWEDADLTPKAEPGSQGTE